jgi:hypothetical protein
LTSEFTMEQVRRFTLERHFLTQTAERKQLAEVASRICGLNAQSARGQYLSLWSRIRGFKQADLAKALYEDKSLVRAWLVRGTVHAVPAADFAIYHKAVGRLLAEGWDDTVLKRDPDLHSLKPRLYPRVMEALGTECLTKQDVITRLRSLLRGHTVKARMRLVSRALRGLAYQGLVCHAEPTGPWYHFKDNRFAALSTWQPGIDLDAIDETEARQQLLLRYLNGYGPASVQDFAYWTGLKVREATAALDAVKQDLTSVTIRGQKGRYWLLSRDLEANPNSPIARVRPPDNGSQGQAPYPRRQAPQEGVPTPGGRRTDHSGRRSRSRHLEL